ncbi:MAG TPA: cupin domain-containing protein [Thermodesulfobacteriota bacterium]|nr:cupin domain-containing protein [Thermodesulfobacteriota bacterium]
MPKKQLAMAQGFAVVMENSRAQAATMVLAPGESEGGPGNRHRGADQWLFVVSGSGRAILRGKGQEIKAGTLLLIEKGATHEIRNTGRRPLETLNFYVPPAYTRGGDPLPRGKS